MSDLFGYSFSPDLSNRFKQSLNSPTGASQLPQNVGQALQVLSLHLPSFTGGSPIAPDALLHGGRYTPQAAVTGTTAPPPTSLPAPSSAPPPSPDSPPLSIFNPTPSGPSAPAPPSAGPAPVPLPPRSPWAPSPQPPMPPTSPFNPPPDAGPGPATPPGLPNFDFHGPPPPSGPPQGGGDVGMPGAAPPSPLLALLDQFLGRGRDSGGGGMNRI